MSSEHIGPSLWHGREVNSCTRCKYLRCHLVKSGRNPDYEYFCMHPITLSGEHRKASNDALLERVKEQFPDRLEYFTKYVADYNATIAKNGSFISNDRDTPEAPYWCPVITGKHK